MKKAKIGIYSVVILCILSLAGFLVFELIWAGKVVISVNDRYSDRTISALKAISAEYAERSSLEFDSLSTKERLDETLLDSLLIVYTKKYKLSEKYEYSVVGSIDADSAYYMFDTEYYTTSLAKTVDDDKVSKADGLWLKLYFPDKKKHILEEIRRELVPYYAVLGLAIAFCLFYLVRVVIQQRRLAQQQADFIHSMIHELKTPVATIDMSSQVLKKAGITIMDYEKLRNYAGIVGEENNRIWACVDSLLQMLTVNKRSLNLKKEQVDVNSTIQAAVDGFSVATMAQPVTFNLRLNNELPLILADKMHIRAIVDNIIDNAIKYSPNNSTISIATQQTKRNVIVIIEDNGKGISKKNQRHIFKKFYRVSSDKKKGTKGFGLGLHYVKEVAEAHGGSVNVKSKLNKGTYIGVILPIE